MKKANEPDENLTASEAAPAPKPEPTAPLSAAVAGVGNMVLPISPTLTSPVAVQRALTEDRWQLKEHRNPGHWACVPYGTTIDQITEPKFWANVARHLRPNSTIEVHWDDSSQFAEFYVLSAGRNWASVSLLSHHKLDKPKMQQQASEYGVSYAGPVDRFRVTRLADNAVIRAGFPSEGEARKFLDEYLRKLAA